MIRSTIEKLKYPSETKLSRTDIQHLRNSNEKLMQLIENLADFKELHPDISEMTKHDISEMADFPINRDIYVMIVVKDTQLADVIRRCMARFMTASICDTANVIDTISESRPDAIIIDTDNREQISYDLINNLKCNPEFKTIPIILISDFHDSRNLLKAIKSEADDFLPKPFNCEVLAALTLKKIKASKINDSLPQNVKAQVALLEKESDKMFLENIDRIIENNIADPEFDINTLSDKLKISRAHLYNKIKELKGMSPAEYLRDTRLSKASLLLKESSLTIKEIRAMVGMPDPNNLNRRFKEKFKTLPSDFR